MPTKWYWARSRHLMETGPNRAEGPASGIYKLQTTQKIFQPHYVTAVLENKGYLSGPICQMVKWVQNRGLQITKVTLPFSKVKTTFPIHGLPWINWLAPFNKSSRALNCVNTASFTWHLSSMILRNQSRKEEPATFPANAHVRHSVKHSVLSIIPQWYGSCDAHFQRAPDGTRIRNQEHQPTRAYWVTYAKGKLTKTTSLYPNASL